MEFVRSRVLRSYIVAHTEMETVDRGFKKKSFSFNRNK